MLTMTPVQLLRSVVVAVLLAPGPGLAGGGQVPEHPPRKPFTPVGRLDTAVIKESSGVGKSRAYEGIFWTHNDSGNAAELFAIKADGTLVATVPVAGASNLDWEDMAVADGFVYVGDIGNNHGWLRARTIYKFAEPDPYADGGKPIKPLAAYRYKYPDKPFDAEALAVRGERMYVIRKGVGKNSQLYRLTPTDGRTMKLSQVSAAGGLRSAGITGADLSDDGRFLVTASGYQLARYPVNDDLTLRDDEPVRFVFYPRGDEIEACCFDGADVVLTSERGSVYRISAEDIERQTRFVAPRVERVPARRDPKQATERSGEGQ